MKGTLNGLLTVVALVLFALSFYKYVTGDASSNTMWLIGWIIFLIATIAFGGMFLSGRVNKGEDIHITE